MSINKIKLCDNYTAFYKFSWIDQEEVMIMRRLMMYGIEPTGKKSIDKEKLHEIKLREAKKLDIISSKFLTITKNEQEKIQKKKKDRKVEQNPKAYPNSEKGAKILGEQIYLAIQMKKEVEKKLKERNKTEKKV